MNELPRFLPRLLEQLDAASLPYMLAGSMASSIHGEPRSTTDVDLVIAPEIAALSRLLSALDPESFYVDPDTAREAVRRRRQFNLIELETAWKVDLIVRKDDDYSLQAFERARELRLGDHIVRVERAEDTILSKLRWSRRAGGSERQERDVAGILAVRGEYLDWEYLHRWAAHFDLVEDLQRLR